MAELACGIASICFKSDLQMSLKTSLRSTIERSDRDDMVAWNNAQEKLKCCGIEGPADWRDFSRNHSLPSSCCVPQYIDQLTKDCREAPPLYQDKYYQAGCLDKIEERIQSNGRILVGVGIGIAFIQIFGIILALWLAFRIRKERAK